MFHYSHFMKNIIIHGDSSRISISLNEAEDKEEEITIQAVAQKWNSYTKRMK